MKQLSENREGPVAVAENDPISPLVQRAGALAGHLAGVDDEGRLLFRPEDGEAAVAIAIAVALSDEELVRAAWLGQRALVMRGEADPTRLTLVGLVRERVATAAQTAALNGVSVKVDGEQVHLTAQKSIELRCGKARLLLRKDGHIEMSGTHLLTRSRGAVKIKGATIALN
jgi:hypothetical protein